jgi:hypothetical protein
MGYQAEVVEVDGRRVYRGIWKVDPDGGSDSVDWVRKRPPENPFAKAISLVGEERRPLWFEGGCGSKQQDVQRVTTLGRFEDQDTMKLIIEVQDVFGAVVHRSTHTTKFNPTEIVLAKPFEIDGWVVKAFSLGIDRDRPTAISLTKTYKTRDDHKVQLYSVSAKGIYPVVGLISYPDGHDLVMRWTKNGGSGEISSPQPSDLVEVKK